MKNTKIFLFLCLWASLCYSQIIFTEFMINPLISETTDEFIEIYNTSDSTVNLQGFTLSDGSDTDSLIAVSGILIEAHQYAIILDRDYLGEYENLIPDSVLRVTINDSRFGAYGLSNSSIKTYSLINKDSLLSDTYTSSTDNPEGFSDERIRLDKNEWGNSIVLNGTPGYINSVSPREFAVEAELIELSYDDGILGVLRIYNRGLKAIDTLHYSIWTDENNDSHYSENENVILGEFSESLTVYDSLDIPFQLESYCLGYNSLKADIYIRSDNHFPTESSYYFIPPDSEMVKISEFCPVPGETITSEFIEIYNASEQAVNLQGLQIRDLTGMDSIPEYHLMAPGSYTLLLQDSCLWEQFAEPENWVQMTNWRSLNNSGDRIALLFKDVMIDELFYDESWDFEADMSLERVSFKLDNAMPGSWKNSPGSPGFTNVNTLADFDFQITEIKDIQFKNDRFSLSCELRNTGENSIESISYTLFLDENFDSLFSASEIQIQNSFSCNLNTFDTLCFPLSFTATHWGAHYFRLELQHFTGLTLSERATIYSPLPPESLIITEFIPIPGERHLTEYIECQNRSSDILNIQGIHIYDATGHATLLQSLILQPNEILLIAESEKILENFPEPEHFMILLNWRSLNNTEDEIVFRDYYNTLIDSLHYDGEWVLENDMALELINPVRSRSYSDNWEAVETGSPGLLNPSYCADKEVSILNFQLPSGIVEGSSIPFSFELINTGQESINELTLTIMCDMDLDEIYSENEIFYQYTMSEFLDIGQSQYISGSFTMSKSGTFPLRLHCSYADMFYDTLNSAYSVNPLLINEVMPSPVSPESEWIELVNISSDTVNLKDWLIADAVSQTIITKMNTFLNPGAYLILSETEDVLYNYPQTSQSVFIPVKFPTLNSYSDKVRLFDHCGTTVDFMEYGDTFPAKPAVSFERIKESTLADWDYCVSDYKATPGQKNSLYQLEYAIENLDKKNYYSVTQSTPELSLLFQNSGYENLENFEIKLLYGVYPLFSAKEALLEIKDSLKINPDIFSKCYEGFNLYKLVIQNDVFHFEDSLLIFKPFAQSPLCMNEVLFEPIPEKMQGEFIELAVGQDGDFRFWTLSSNQYSYFLPENLNQPYWVITADSLFYNQLENSSGFISDDFPTLTNSGAILKLADPAGVVVDSVNLTNHPQLAPGLSLERKYEYNFDANPDLWNRNVSSSGHSAGRRNSVSSDYSEQNTFRIEPEIFQIKKECEPLRFLLESKRGILYVTISIYDMRGRKRYELKENTFNQPGATLFWDGYDKQGHLLNTGLYMVLAKVHNINGKVKKYKRTLVIVD